MEKEKFITLIEMLEREIEEVSNLPGVGHRVVSAIYLINYIKSAVRNEEPIDLEELRAKLETFEKIKKKSEKDIITEIQNADAKTLDELAFLAAADTVFKNANDDEQINKEEFNQPKEYHMFLLKNGLVGKPIQTVEYNGYYAEQFQNFKILFSKDNGESVFCNYFKKATKQELKKLIDDIKAGKTKSKVLGTPV